ncbi:MAG: hypothetical protein JNL05_10580 [Flavobacteriales bacterium]|nr:hypothetical protein [Flavobacteriales bacterium]
MTEHTDITYKAGVALVTGAASVISFLFTGDVLQAVLVGAVGGLVAGFTRGLGQHAWRKLAKRLKLEHHHDEDPKKQ